MFKSKEDQPWLPVRTRLVGTGAMVQVRCLCLIVCVYMWVYGGVCVVVCVWCVCVVCVWCVCGGGGECVVVVVGG